MLITSVIEISASDQIKSEMNTQKVNVTAMQWITNLRATRQSRTETDPYIL